MAEKSSRFTPTIVYMFNCCCVALIFAMDKNINPYVEIEEQGDFPNSTAVR